MSAITAKARRKMKKYAVLTREPRCFLGSFDFSWEQRKFSDITFPAGEKNRDNLPLESYSITNEHGFVPQDEKFENGGTMREADKRMYYIVSPNSFAYNPARINVGSIGYQNIGKNVIVSSLYEVFKTSEDVDDRLLWHWFKSPDFQKLIMQLQEGGVRLYFYYDKLCMGEVSLPSLEEQRKIGKLFDTLDNLITLHQRKCVFLFSFFRACISMNFTASTFSWEQRKFGEVFDCTVPNNTLSRAELSYDEGTVLNVHYGDVLIKYGSVLDVQKDDIPRIPHRCREDFNGALLQDGDIIIADTAEDETTGKACEISNLQGSVIVSGLHTMVCRPRNRMALGYLGYYLNSNAYHHQLLPLMQGIKVLSLSRSNIQKTSVSYPTAVKEQQHIAYYFSQLDNLITLHQRECISFTGSAGRLILTANKKRTASSWEQRKLSEMCGTFEYGLNAAAKEFDGKNKYIRITDIDDASREFLLSDLSSPDICLDGMSKYLLSSGDIVFARTGASVGKTYIYRENDGIVYFAGFLIRAKVNQDNDAEFVFQSTLSPSYEKYIRITSQRSGQPGVNAQEYSEYDLFAPSKEEQQRIGHFLRGIDNLITLHQRKPFLMKWRTSDANRNQTNRLVL